MNIIKTMIWSALVLVLTAAVPGWAQVRHDSAIFMVDVSGTMSDAKQVPLEKKLVQDMNARFPSYVKSGGLMTFGHKEGPQMNWWYPVGKWDKARFDAAAAKIVDGNGTTPIGSALEEVRDKISKSEGKTALIIMSDGKNNGWVNSVKMAKKVKNEFGDKICIFTILYGDDKKGGQLLADIALAGQCGMGSLGPDLKSSEEVQYLVDYIFPRTGTKVAPPTAKLKPRLALVELNDTHFDFDSAKLTPAGITVLDENIKILKSNPEVNILIAGYASASGTDEYNQKLSEKRATSVKDYLVSKGIGADRLMKIGYGESRPATYEPYPEDLESEAAKSNMRVLFTVIVK
jgi:outer membrane protein OmpA-like peptidoglycan-associated protein